MEITDGCILENNLWNQMEGKGNENEQFKERHLY